MCKIIVTVCRYIEIVIKPGVELSPKRSKLPLDYICEITPIKQYTVTMTSNIYQLNSRTCDGRCTDGPLFELSVLKTIPFKLLVSI